MIEYLDPQEGFKGWLALDALHHRLCAGGMRVQPGLTGERVADLARNMTRKMRLCGLRVDGAKCGIDYDPSSPGKPAAMARFMAAIQPYIVTRYSMGPDLNVEMAELDAIGQTLGIPSVKMAVANAQGWDLGYFGERYRLLQQEVDGWPLGKIRAGYGVAAAALAVLDHLGIPPQEARVTVQGFGTLAKATLYGLGCQGVQIVGLADAEKCVMVEDGRGLGIDSLLKTGSTLLPGEGYDQPVTIGAREQLTRIPCDLLIPAAVESTVTGPVAAELQVEAVVPGANLAVTSEAETLLGQKGILVLPDFLTGSGGSLSMEGLFSPVEHPAPKEVLEHVARRMARLVARILTRSRAESISPTRAALAVCAETRPQPGTRPYGDP